MTDIMPISQTGYDKLKEELEKLEIEAVELRKRVEEARQQGDLKENGEYIYGRQNLGFCEGRMGEIRGKLNFSKVTDCTTVPTDKAGFGTVVTLLNLETQNKVTYELLGPHDADLTDDSISIVSPIGAALVDRVIGDKIEVTVPRGDIAFEILEIKNNTIK